MQSREFFALFCPRLDALELAYFITGSVASTFYGQPRLTNDIDIVVFLSGIDPKQLAAAFPGEEYYCPPIEVLRIEANRPRRGHFNIIHHATGCRADIYVAEDSEFFVWARRSARRATVEGVEIRLAPPEYVIVNKLEYYREGNSRKHLPDIQSMLEAGTEIDWSVVEREVTRRGLGKELKAIRPL